MLILCTTTLRIAGIVSKDPKVSPSQHVEERGIGEDAREGRAVQPAGQYPCLQSMRMNHDAAPTKAAIPPVVVRQSHDKGSSQVVR